MRFAQAVGVQTKLQVKKASCRENPDWPRLERESGKRTRSVIDEDYIIEFLGYLLCSPNIELSRLVWRTMCTLDRQYLTAHYQKNEQRGPKVADSQLVYCLRNAKWVPQITDLDIYLFRRPAEASKELLPEGFLFDRGYEWLSKVGFGDNKARQSASAQQEILAAQAVGFRDLNELGMGLWFAKLPPEERRRLQEDHERTQQIELPGHTPRNPELRAERVEKQAAEAPERLTEQRMRSVSVGREAVKQEAKLYLREQYTNSDGEMICQVCKDQAPLPFRLADGCYYFEAVEFVPESALKRLHYQNYLALCPNHAAMYQHANGSEKEMKALLQGMQGHELAVVLAQENTTIYFTETHMLDLRAVIAAEQGKDL